MNMNEYKLFGTKSKEIANALKILKMSLFLGFLKKLKEQDKLKSDDIENELIKYIESNMTELRYLMIKDFKDGLKKLRVKKIRIKNETQKNAVKRKLHMLVDKISNTLEELD